MSQLRTTRRAFLAAPAFIPHLISAPRYSTVRLAGFGAGNMAFITINQLASHPKVKVVCVADVDSAMFAQVKTKFPDARLHEDWRRMLDREHKNVDIACVGTPDHMHAPIAMSAFDRGLHVYQQKPLAHDVFEVRRLTETARRKKLVTQMGIQVHSDRRYRIAVQLLQSGAIGKVKDVHSFSEKKWGDTEPQPAPTGAPPSTLNWDLWLGTAAARPFIGGEKGNEYYHPVNWRKRIDFGTATFGDMGCHIYDPVFSGLQLTAPLSVRSEGPAPSEVSWALNSVIHYVFPGTPYTDGKTVNVTWYDGDARPPAEVQALLGSVKIPGQGSVFIGTKGVMLLPHTALPVLLPEDQFHGFTMPELESNNHYHQFVEAVMGNGTTSAGFDYAGPLTEAVLLGPLATRCPNATLEWNSARLRFKNSPEADRFLRRQYRDGWHVRGLS
jgi:predicted dehydrogenase